MARRHLFVIVVVLAAAAVAGLLALTQGAQQTASASPTVDAQIAARTRSLDRLERSLRRALAKQTHAVPMTARASSTPRTVYVRASAAAPQSGEHHGDEHGEAYDHEHEGGDD
jgi:hypothetical protein